MLDQIVCEKHLHLHQSTGSHQNFVWVLEYCLLNCSPKSQYIRCSIHYFHFQWQIPLYFRKFDASRGETQFPQITFIQRIVISRPIVYKSIVFTAPLYWSCILWLESELAPDRSDVNAMTHNFDRQEPATRRLINYAKDLTY